MIADDILDAIIIAVTGTREFVISAEYNVKKIC